MRILLATFALSISSPALALSCQWGLYGANVGNGEAAPQNAAIVVHHTFEADTDTKLLLLDAEGQEVAATIDNAYHYSRLLPDADLAPGDYTLTSDDPDSIGFIVAFTVEAATDNEAPAAPAIHTTVRESSKTEWGTERGIRIEADEVEGAAHYEYELSTEEDFSQAASYLTGYSSAFLGQGLCDASVPDYDHSERYFVRMRAVDAAGNASEWSEAEGKVKGAGCSTVSGTPGALGALWVLGLLAVRRRS